MGKTTNDFELNETILEMVVNGAELVFIKE